MQNNTKTMYTTIKVKLVHSKTNQTIEKRTLSIKKGRLYQCFLYTSFQLPI